MSYPTHNNSTVSPKTTGTANPNNIYPSDTLLEQQSYPSRTIAEHQNDFQLTPLQSPAPVYTESNEKAVHSNADAQYPMATPQQQQYNNEAKQGILMANQQYQQQTAPPRNNYQMAVPLANLQQGAAPVDCPICGVREMTKTEYVTGGTTHLSALLFCCFTCLGCIPYIAHWFKDCEHKCGNCDTLLAVWHRSGRTEVMAHARG